MESLESCCRLCLMESASLVDIFQVQDDTTISEMIKEICAVEIEIESTDVLPRDVCAECLDVITAAYNLRLTSQKNDRLLRGEPDEIIVKEEIIEFEPEDDQLTNSDYLEVAYIMEDSNYSCDKCPEVRSSKDEIQQHITDSHMHMCNICNKQCKTEFTLKMHIERVHDDDRLVSVYSCDYCKSTFKTPKKLEKHKQMHSYFDEIIEDDTKLTYKCRFENCNKTYDTYGEKMFMHIKNHERTIQAEASKESFVCPHCGQCYKSKQILHQHVKRHFDTGERYPCPSCPQKFKSWGELYYHKAVHMTERPFICDVCNKGFKAKRDLKNHKKRHEEKDVKNFQCSYCHLMLKSRYTLNRHMLIHTGEKPHVCSYCQKSFTQKNELNKHLRIHVGENTYKCQYDGCAKAYRLLAELRIHQEDHYLQNN